MDNSELHIKDLQRAYVGKTIREVLAIHPVTFEQLQAKSLKKLIPHTTPNAEDKALVKEEIFNLLIDGKIDINKGKIRIEGRYRVNSVEEDYKIDNITTLAGIKNINGNNVILSVGSERYPFFWSNLEISSVIPVELIAEPNNKKDPLAVAICIDKKPYAYLPREEAANYHPSIMLANKQGFSIMTEAIVSFYEENPSVKLFKLEIASPQLLNKHFQENPEQN
jgi:hypothetical protein